MGFFSTPKPKRVTTQEFKEVMSRLYGVFDEAERNDVEKLFRADLYEPGRESGITREEFDAGIAWLNENMSKHALEENDIEILKQYFEEHLND